METIDPATGAVLPADAIQRVLFIANAVHVYNIPPLPSTRGHTASTWTSDPARQIFTSRLRILETSNPNANPELKVDVVLEDASSGALFAAAPYTQPSAIEPVIDSSRFFAVTVRDPSGRKAVLGIGFEERSDAFDFGVALQGARRGLGWDAADQSRVDGKSKEAEVKDYSLKEGETITVNIGSKGSAGRRRPNPSTAPESTTTASLQSFALPPPPGPASSSGGFSLPPPPSADDVKRKRQSAQDLGFDDGQFGEFA